MWFLGDFSNCNYAPKSYEFSTNQEDTDIQQKLHVESLWGSLLLPVEHILLRLLEVLLGHLHPPLSESEQTSLSADCLDVSSREIVLGHDILFKVNILSKGHFPCVDAKDSALGLLIRERELNFPVNSARSDQGGVKCLNPIGC